MRIEELGDPFARREFARFVLFLDPPRAAALAKAGLQMLKGFDKAAHVGYARLFLNRAGRLHPVVSVTVGPRRDEDSAEDRERPDGEGSELADLHRSSEKTKSGFGKSG